MCDFMIDVVVKNRKLNSSCKMFVIYVGKIDMILFVCWMGNILMKLICLSQSILIFGNFLCDKYVKL